jgi:glutamyl-tRNA reductase
MQVAVLGTNHTLANLPLRELWIRSLRKVVSSWELPYPVSYILLITCNRCEIFFASEDLHHTAERLQYWLQQEMEQPVAAHSYLFFGKECFHHLAKVASGLESAQIGETDVRRQVKQAYEKAKSSQNLSSDLHFLFQKSLKIGKQFLGALHGIEKQPTLEKVLLEMLLKMDEKRSIFFLGNSQLNRKLIQRLIYKGERDIFLCSHQHQAPFPQDQVKMLDFTLLSFWQQCDIVVCASDPIHYVINPPATQVKTRLILDLSVPRCANPALERSHGLPILNMEYLNLLLEKNQLQYQDRITAAKESVSVCVDRLFATFEKKNLYFRKLWTLPSSRGCSLPLQACFTTSTHR